MRYLMTDVVHLVRIGADTARRIADDGVVFPGTFPQIVEHLQVLGGVVVSGVLCALADGRLIAGVVDVLGAKYVGDEQPVEPTAFRQLGQLGPVGQILVPAGLVVGVSPPARGLVRNAIHIDRVETNDAGHSLSVDTPTILVTGCTRGDA